MHNTIITHSKRNVNLPPRHRTGFKASPLSIISRLAEWILQQRLRVKSRRQLLAMNDTQLKDIGLSRGAAYSEGSRHFWD